MEKLSEKTQCKWVKESSIEDENRGSYLTDCQENFYLEEGSPRGHNMKFCCFCGREIFEN